MTRSSQNQNLLRKGCSGTDRSVTLPPGATPGEMEEAGVIRKIVKGPASPWKHKAKVLLAYLALCAITAFSGLGSAAGHDAPAGSRPGIQIFR
ncbi:MAG: hypothetical protein KJZ92_02625 [Rhodocyclaceae bacterium]|nr:hypothetical protein [Rhodocyclaceae bacterium]MCL4680142.1 hypothetical protein [Rhodocyclaceae bacterium]